MATPLTADEHLQIIAQQLRKLRWANYETTKTLTYELDRNAMAQMGHTLCQLLEIVEILVTQRMS